MDTKIGSLDNCKPVSNDVCSQANDAVSTIQGSVSPAVVNCSKATVGGHLAKRLVQIGVNDVFSVPGDFNLTLLDHLIAEPGLNLIGCCNELNAGYAADGYTRSHGVGACVVIFTVGGLSILNAIAGAYSESLPLIYFVGGPNSNDYGTNRILHHTVGLPDFSQELRCFQTVTCYQAVINNLEDAHEMIDTAILTVTAQDVSTMLRLEIHDGPYNVIKNWNYIALVDAIHNVEGKCWTTKVFCEEELVEAIEMAIGAKKDSLCFIEVIVHKDDTSKELLEWGSRVCAANSRPPTP
ncbi:hypothetical protein GOBAR_AA13551 [Gossypium barbadense]|uniref:pyruvate decarboxylase n=1 Tax=Gossypium barbadense TaxID=3634 RepID=A0A2P5XUS3_GOSBA|nr:hypothetical protein GOBAR_AA13551 [Gossypium barbadense]